MKPLKTSQTDTHSNSGFALLMTLIVVSVVISIGISVLDLSIKQIRLSTNARDSEIAFHAANAGMECARYIRQSNSDAMERGESIASAECFRSTPSEPDPEEIIASVTGDGEVYKYDYSFTWPGTPQCSQITTLVASSSDLGTGLTIGNMSILVPGYPGGSDKTCGAGERCTVISVRGYNKNCSDVTSNSYGIVQREVLVQF